MFAKHTLNYVLFDEISLLLLPEISLISVFSTAAIYIFFYYTLSSIFSNHSVGGNLSRLCLCISSAQRMFVVRTLCIPP